MLSPIIKKRTHSEDTAVEESLKKKTKFFDSPTSLPYDSDSSPSPQSSNDANEYSPVTTTERPITLTRQKRDKRRILYASTMDLVKIDTTIQMLENIPYPTLNANASWRPYLNLPNFTQLPHYEQQGWRLCAILFDRQQQQQPTPSSLSKDTTTESLKTKAEIIQKQTFDFKRWLIQTVSSNAEPALQAIKKQEPNDSYAEIFTCMTFGRIHEAASIAMKKMDDYVLAIFLASPLSPENAIRQRNKLSKEKLKNKYHEKIWRLLSGQVDSELTDGLDWKQALMLYIMYGKTRSGEDPLNTLIERYLNDTRKLGKTIKERDSSPWYNMIQWWWQRTYNCQKLNTVNISGWPARLAWRFVLMFHDELSTTLVTSIIQRWCMELQTIGLSEWAIFSSLFTSNKEIIIFVLSRSSFDTNEYKIPEGWIKEAKEKWQSSLTFIKDTPSIAQSL